MPRALLIAVVVLAAGFSAAVRDPLCLTGKPWDFQRLYRSAVQELRGHKPMGLGLWRLKENLPPAQPRYSEACILAAAASRMEVALREDIPPPRIRYESRTSISEFQDAVERQWGFRPEVILNVYIPERNEIYIMDDASYYSRLGRFVDDSLAHEYAHFLQVRYRGVRLDQDPDNLESEAVSVQGWFRETYMLRVPADPPAACRSR